MGRKVTSGTISVDLASDDDLRQLANWLRDEDELRGRVRVVDQFSLDAEAGRIAEVYRSLLRSP